MALSAKLLANPEAPPLANRKERRTERAKLRSHAVELRRAAKLTARTERWQGFRKILGPFRSRKALSR